MARIANNTNLDMHFHMNTEERIYENGRRGLIPQLRLIEDNPSWR